MGIQFMRQGNKMSGIAAIPFPTVKNNSYYQKKKNKKKKKKKNKKKI